MRFAYVLTLAIGMSFGSFAMASAMVECGKKVVTDKNGGTSLQGRIFHISAQDDDFTGPATKDGNWEMTFNGTEYPPEKATASVEANKDGFVKKIIIDLVVEKIPTKLIVDQPYSDNPKLIELMKNKAGKYNRGGSWDCLSDQD